MTPPTPHARPPRVYLTGFMGCGKSTVGPILANTLGYAYVDLDSAIESRSGKSIASLFGDSGEEEFRRIEQDVFRTVSAPSRIVVSLGGGALTDQATLAHARATGVLVYLQASIDDIVIRLRRKTDRPLLLSPNGEPLSDRAFRERVRALLAEREPVYRTADIIVDTAGSKLGLTVDHIARDLLPLLPR